MLFEADDRFIVVVSGYEGVLPALCGVTSGEAEAHVRLYAALIPNVNAGHLQVRAKATTIIYRICNDLYSVPHAVRKERKLLFLQSLVLNCTRLFALFLSFPQTC